MGVGQKQAVKPLIGRAAGEERVKGQRAARDGRLWRPVWVTAEPVSRAEQPAPQTQM